MKIQIDAFQSESFDKEDLGLMHFDRRLDEKRLPKLPTFDLSPQLPPDGPDMRQFTLRGTVTDRWGLTSEPFQRAFVVTRPSLKVQTVESKSISLPHEATNAATIPVPSDLTNDADIGNENASVEIRGRVVTHGHRLTVTAKNLASFAGEIVTGPTTLGAPAPAAPG